MKSPKEVNLEQKIYKSIKNEDPKVKEILDILFEDEEIAALQEVSNTVSIKRLGFNDHGPVHMKQVTYNVIKMAKLLNESGVKFNIEEEQDLPFYYSLISLILSSCLHDAGMSIMREDHELWSAVLVKDIITRVLDEVFKDDIKSKVILRSTSLEGIVGHMATRKVSSLESGLVLVADGCDMEKGRARIPLAINAAPSQGDIHRYSADSIERVKICKGDEKPIKIIISMNSYAGLFQVEEVLMGKLNSSSAKKYIELIAMVNEEEKKYL